MRNLYLFLEVNISFVVLNVLFNTVQGSWLLTCSLFFVIPTMLDNYSKSDTSKPFTQCYYRFLCEGKDLNERSYYG